MADKGAFSFGVLEFSPGNPQFPVLPTGPLQGTLDPLGSAASLTFEKGTVIVLDTRSATPADLFADWFVGTTWVSPAPVEFGNITATKTRDVTLHNTRRVSAQLDSIEPRPLRIMVGVPTRSSLNNENFGMKQPPMGREYLAMRKDWLPTRFSTPVSGP